MRWTRWMQSEPRSWMSDVRQNQKGVGSRYVFPRHIVDFSPDALAKEVYRQKLLDPRMKSFASTVNGYEAHCDTTPLTADGDVEIVSSSLQASLPYRVKVLPELPGYSPDMDFHVIGDKLLTVEVC